MAVDVEKINQDNYSTLDLRDAPWFPVDSVHTIIKYIENGDLGAVNISTKENKTRWKIPRDEVIEFLQSRST